MLKMLFQVTICLLLCQAFGSAIGQQYQSGNPHQLRSFQEEISPVFNEIAPEDGPYEDISYKPVTLEAAYNITKKQQHCLKIGNEVKSISRASLWAPLSNSKHHDTLKVVCSNQQKPEMWFGQSKYQESNHDEKVQTLTYEDTDTAIVSLVTTMGTLSFELPGCNVCVKKNEADPNYVNIFIAPSNEQAVPRGSQVNFDLQEPSIYREKKIRVKRATTSIKLSSTSAKKNVGETFTVTCSAKTSNITWRDPKGKEVKSSVNSDPRVRESFTKSQNYSELIFRSTSVAVDGKYTCTVNEGGKLDTEIFTLSVAAPIVKPKAKLTPSTKKVNLEEGSDYTVECSGNSINVTWKYPLNNPIPTYPGGPSYFYMSTTNLNKTSLIFKNVTSSFAGEYTCSVNSSGLQDTEKLTITIKKPRLTFSPDDKEDISVKENKEYDITCEGPLTSVTWYYNNKEVSKNKKDDVFQKNPETKDGKMQAKLKFDDVQGEVTGKYTCSGILSFNGSRIERSFTLKALEDNNLNAPKLKVGDDTISTTNIYYRVNESLEVVCKGDTDTIEWKGPPYNWKIPESSTPTSNRIEAERTKKKKVALKFKSVAISDEGTYTCEVSKRTVTKSQTFKLNVIDPVRIIGLSQNPTTTEGGYVTLGCLTTGHPKAMVNWYYNDKQPDGTSARKLIDGQTNVRFKFDGDNLQINNITYREAGRYMCEAKQDIERGATDMRTIDITVLHKPYPSRNHTIFERKLNTTIQIPCKMLANPAAYYTWYQRNPVDGQYTQLTQPSAFPELQMNFQDKSQYGEYKCRGNNDIGYNEQYILLIPMEPPRPPKVELDKVYKTYAYFKAVAERNSSFTYYNIEYKEKDTRDWTDVNQTLGETWDTKYELTNLFEKTTYILRVRSINELGRSEPSNEVQFTTALGTRLTVSFAVLFAILIKWLF